MTWESFRALMLIVFMLSCIIILISTDLKRKYKYILVAGVVVAWLIMQYLLIETRSQTVKTWCESREGKIEYVPTVGNVCIVEKHDE